MKTKIHKVILAALLLCGAAFAGHDRHPAKNWNALQENILKPGLSMERLERTLEACRRNQLTVEDAGNLLCPVYTAQEENLPTECVFLKIEEGLAKHISWQEIRQAADMRLNCMRRAERLVMAGRDSRGGQHQHLVMHTCMALESGLSEEVFQDIFNRPGGFRYGRVIRVVEGGESLHLAGLSGKDTKQFMNDCLDRDLNGGEITRAVNFVLTGLRAGKDSDSIRKALWVQ